jgi:membrane protein required for colicin V production
VILSATSTTLTVPAEWLDPVLLGLIALSSILGLWRGLLRSAAGLAGLVLAALFAGRLAAYMDPALKQAGMAHPAINGRWAFLIAFIAIVLAVEMVANALVWVERIMLLGWVDRLGGIAFGAARGVLLGMILLAGLAQFDSANFNQQVQKSQVAAWLWNNVPSATNMLPAGMRQSTIRLIHDRAPFLQQPLAPRTP